MFKRIGISLKSLLMLANMPLLGKPGILKRVREIAQAQYSTLYSHAEVKRDGEQIVIPNGSRIVSKKLVNRRSATPMEQAILHTNSQRSPFEKLICMRRTLDNSYVQYQKDRQNNTSRLESTLSDNAIRVLIAFGLESTAVYSNQVNWDALSKNIITSLQALGLQGTEMEALHDNIYDYIEIVVVGQGNPDEKYVLAVSKLTDRIKQYEKQHEINMKKAEEAGLLLPELETELEQESYILDRYFKKGGLRVIPEDVWAHWIISSDARIVNQLHEWQQNNAPVRLTPKQTALLWLFDEMAAMIQKPTGFDASKIVSIIGASAVGLLALSTSQQKDLTEEQSKRNEEMLRDSLRHIGGTVRSATAQRKIVEFDLGSVARLLANQTLKGKNASEQEYAARVKVIYDDAIAILNSFHPIVQQAIANNYKIRMVSDRQELVSRRNPLTKLYKKQEQAAVQQRSWWQKITNPWVLGSAAIAAAGAAMWYWFKK